MKGLKNSVNNALHLPISRRGWRWIGILYCCSILFYREFFSWYQAFGLAFFITVLITGMLLVGYVRLGIKLKFPTGEFTLFTILFSALRFTYIYFFLSKHLPEYTIFHYPYRALPATIFGTASLLFLGYSYAIYEWGLAAREKYTAKTQDIQLTQQATAPVFPSPLALRHSGKTAYVLPEDIIFINANGEYVDYNTAERKYTCFQRLKEVEKEMKRLGFLRTHRSYIVNPTYIASLAKKEIVLKNGVKVPMSKTYRDSVQQALEQAIN